nr:hypothetical protein [Tanacetum cinerariifolium]
NRKEFAEAPRSCPCAAVMPHRNKGQPFVLARCHFPLMNPFGVARVTTFAIACKAYGEGEPSLPLFRSLYNVGPVEPFGEALRDRLTCHPFEAQTFLEAILYLAGLASSWKCALNASLIFINGEEMSFQNFMKRPSQTHTFSTRHAEESIDVGSPSMEYAKAVDDDDQGEKRSITTDLEEGAIVVRRSAIGRSSKHEGKKRKQEGPR